MIYSCHKSSSGTLSFINLTGGFERDGSQMMDKHNCHQLCPVMPPYNHQTVGKTDQLRKLDQTCCALLLQAPNLLKMDQVLIRMGRMARCLAAFCTRRGPTCYMIPRPQKEHHSESETKLTRWSKYVDVLLPRLALTSLTWLGRTCTPLAQGFQGKAHEEFFPEWF